MKQLTTTLLFSVICVFSFAQTPFTEQTLLDMNKRMMQDYAKFIVDEVSPEYTFTNADGAIISYQAMKAMKSKIVEWHTHDLKIKQIGNATFVRGINDHSIQSATSDAIWKYSVHFIYTYEYKNGKWLWLSAHHIYNNPSKADEEVTIKKLIEEERSVYHSGKSAELQKMWKDDAKTFHVGETWSFDNETLKKLIPTIKPSGATAVLSNYRIKINGNMAVADFDQITNNTNGGKSTAHGVVILEKTNRQWLFTGSSIHGTLTKEDNPEEIVKQWIAEYNKDGKSFLKIIVRTILLPVIQA